MDQTVFLTTHIYPKVARMEWALVRILAQHQIFTLPTVEPLQVKKVHSSKMLIPAKLATTLHLRPQLAKPKLNGVSMYGVSKLHFLFRQITKLGVPLINVSCTRARNSLAIMIKLIL